MKRNVSLTPAQWLITGIGLFLCFGHGLLPGIPGFDARAMGIVCIFTGTMLMLLFVDLMWPVLCAVLAFPMTGVYSFDTTIRMAFGNQVVWFIVFSGMIFSAMQRTGLLRRIAIWMISLPFTKKNPWYFVISVWGSCFLLGLVIDVVALIMLYTTLLIEIFGMLKLKQDDRFAQQLLAGCLVVSGLSYGCTPIGHIISMIALSYFEPYGLTFASYTLAGVVVGFVSFAVIVLVFRYIFCMDVSAIRSFDPTSLKRSISARWTAEQIWCAGIYLFLVVLWLLPSLLQPVWPSLYHYLNSLTNCMPLVLGVVLMSLIPVNGKPLMDFKQEIKDGAPWGAVFAVSAAMLLGAALSDADAGIPDVLCSLLEPLFANVPAMIFVAAIGILCCLMTNFSSDTVTLLLFGTITLTLLESGALQVSGAAMGLILGILSCTAYMTPPASSYAAFVSGCGWLSAKRQLVYGFTCAMITACVVTALGYPLTWLLVR